MLPKVTPSPVATGSANLVVVAHLDDLSQELGVQIKMDVFYNR